MVPIEYHAELKVAHVLLAATSVGLYTVRGVAVLAGRAWPMVASVRWTSVAIDTLLISAGGSLWWMMSLHPGREQWLGVKLGLIVLYIVLGSMALKRAPSRRSKALAFGASLLCIVAVAAIARAHDAGVLLRLLSGSG